MREELNSLFTLIDRATLLEDVINKLENKVESIQYSLDLKNKICNWVVLKKAAKDIGISPSALRQRIKRHQYPENIVWRQKETTGKISINMATIGEYL
jgi:hypothetical protein